MNDVEKVEEAIRSAIRAAETSLLSDYSSDVTRKRTLLEILVTLSKAPDLSQAKKWDEGDIYPAPMQFSKLPEEAHGTRIGAIKVIRATQLGDLVIRKGLSVTDMLLQARCYLGLADSKRIMDALNEAGLLKVKP